MAIRESSVSPLLVMVLLTLGLAGCGGGGGGGGSAPGGSLTPPIEEPDDESGEESDDEADDESGGDDEDDEDNGDDAPPNPGDTVARYTFTVDHDDNVISTYVVDADSGRLTFMAQAATDQGPVALTVHPGGSHVYVANSTDGTVSQYALGADGSLSEIAPAVSAGGGAQSVVIHPSERLRLHRELRRRHHLPIHDRGRRQSRAHCRSRTRSARCAVGDRLSPVR